MTNVSPFIKHVPVWPAAWSGVTIGLFFLSLCILLLFFVFPAEGWHNDHAYPATPLWLWDYLTASQQRLIAQFGWLSYLAHPGQAIKTLQYDLSYTGLTEPITWRAAASAGTFLVCGLYAFISRYSGTEPIDKLHHLGGRLPIFNKRAAKVFSREEATTDSSRQPGLTLAPNATQSKRSDSEHTIIVGSVGAGKTQILKYWLEQLLASKRRILLTDTKGDLTAALPAHSFILLAPHDARSLAWDISRDCKGEAAAGELAAALIPISQDPMWANASRAILTGIIKHLQVSGEDWGWCQLSNLIFSNPQELRALLERCHPEGAKYIALDDNTGQVNRTSYGFLVGLWAAAGRTIAPLARAWGNAEPDQMVSLTEWISDTSEDRRPIVLQRAAQFPELSSAWMQAAISLLSNYAASSALPDSPHRRVWLILDEFAQLKKVAGFDQLLAVGRSKGICCVVGVQDFSQISALYGEKELNTWLNIFGTKIIGRMNGGPSAQFISKEVIGSRRISWQEVSYSSPDQSIFDGSNRAPSTPTKMDLSRYCAAPLTAYYAHKENYYGNETFNRV